jgi:solute carrier family 25 phosphate transporter 23/24/25/41
MQAIRTIYDWGGGLRAFFVGNGLNVVKIFPESAIKFWSFEKAKVALSKIEGLDDRNHISTTSRFAAGGIAGIVSQFVIYPVETLKIRIQSQPFAKAADKSTLNSQVSKSVNSAIMTTARQMYRSGGLMAFWPGLVWLILYFQKLLCILCNLFSPRIDFRTCRCVSIPSTGYGYL